MFKKIIPLEKLAKDKPPTRPFEVGFSFEGQSEIKATIEGGLAGGKWTDRCVKVHFKNEKDAALFFTSIKKLPLPDIAKLTEMPPGNNVIRLSQSQFLTLKQNFPYVMSSAVLVDYRFDDMEFCNVRILPGGLKKNVQHHFESPEEAKRFSAKLKTFPADFCSAEGMLKIMTKGAEEKFDSAIATMTLEPETRSLCVLSVTEAQFNNKLLSECRKPAGSSVRKGFGR